MKKASHWRWSCSAPSVAGVYVLPQPASRRGPQTGRGRARAAPAAAPATRRRRAGRRGRRVRRRRLRRRPVRPAAHDRRARARRARASIAAEITVVGNLIGEATVSVAPRAAGRLQDVSVRLGDRVSRGQRIAKIEDFEIQEQVKQAEAAQEVSKATIRQREADLQLAQTNVERSRNLLRAAAAAQADARRQRVALSVGASRRSIWRARRASQSKARLDELRINLGNTIITSPVNGFVSRRAGRSRAPSSRRTRRSWTSWTSPRCAWWPTSSRRTSRSCRPATPRASRSTRFPGEDVHGPHRPRLAGARSRPRARRRSRSRFRTPATA